MKNIKYFKVALIICMGYCLFPTSILVAQSPQGLNYQAVVRDNAGTILQNQQISIRFTITDGDAGQALYQEIQNVSTNQFGLITLNVGNGAPTSGTFTSIDWATVTAWLQVEMDPSGGTDYVDMGSSPLLSVPYALFAANSGGESVWNTTGTNIFFDNNVGIGTEEPTSPLTIETAVNEIGLTHMTNGGDVVMSTSITDVGGSIGTQSDNIFSLNAGGSGKVHVWPDGRVIIGDDADPSDFTGSNSSNRQTDLLAKLHLATPINSLGWLHVGGPDSIIVAEGIGGVSASLGTYTNHAFRINSNGVGRVHIHPDGNVVVGGNNDGPLGKFTVHTPNNSYGLAQIGGDGQVLSTRIGGSSAGIGTFTNHIMRIFANNIAAINIDPAGNIAMGTPDPLPGYKLSVNGNIKAKELVIETVGWPDYVFDETYKMHSLKELEEFIQRHHHLPNIPAAIDVEKNGVAVGEIQKILLEKIEELTLHIIQLNKRIEKLETDQQ